MLQAPETWVAVGFLLFLGIALYFGLKPIIQGLDNRADRIRKEIQEAEQLREEAQRHLADCKRRQREAQRESEEIIEHAKTEAKRMREQAEADLKAQLERRERLTMDKIQQAEQQAVQEVRNRAVDIAMTAAEKLMRENMSDKRATELLDETIADLPKRLV